MQVLVKYGASKEAVTVPLVYPVLQVQPAGTLVPALLTGQGTAVQVETKKGDVAEGNTAPWKPAAQVQPAGTLAPLVPAGHATAVVSAGEGMHCYGAGDPSVVGNERMMQ